MVIVTQRELAVLFTGQWLSFAFSMTNVLGQLGNALVFTVLPIIGNHDLWTARSSGFALVVASILSTATYFFLGRCTGIHKNANTSGTSSPMKFSDIKKFQLVYWCLNIINCLSTCSTFVIMSFGPSYLVTEGYDAETAGLIIAIMNLLILVAPVSGWIIDKVGHRVKIWIACCLSMAVSFMLMAYDVSDPAVWLMVIGLAFTILNSSVNASVAMVVEENIMGTAYGFVGLLFTSGLLIYPLLIGFLVEETDSWVWAHISFAITNFVSFLAAIVIEVKDRTEHYFEVPVTNAYEVVYSDTEMKNLDLSVT